MATKATPNTIAAGYCRGRQQAKNQKLAGENAHQSTHAPHVCEEARDGYMFYFGIHIYADMRSISMDPHPQHLIVAMARQTRVG